MNDTRYWVIPNLFYGIETYFHTDLDRLTAWKCFDKKSGSLGIWKAAIEGIGILVLIPLSGLME